MPYLSNSRAVGYSYDAAGNVINDGVHSYTYDAENRVIAVNGGSTASYVYDSLGRRAEKITNGLKIDYVYDLSGHASAEWCNACGAYTGWGTIYIYLGGRLLAQYKNSTTHFYHQDHLGSTRLVSGVDQSIADNLDYMPYGEQIIGGSLATHKLTGKERDDESGLDYFGARYYASASGRWMSPDWAAKPTTVPYAVFGDPQSLNLYAYVRNSPIVRMDADGHTNAIYDTPLGTERSGGETWSSGSGDDRYDVTTTEDEHGHITQTIQQVGSSTFLYDGAPIVSTTLPTTNPAPTGCYAQARAKIVTPGGNGFKHAIEQGIMHIGRLKHMFWVVRGSDHDEKVLTGGPDDQHPGFLGEWGPSTKDDKKVAAYSHSGKVIYTAPQTPDLCARVDAMEAGVKDWHFGQIHYAYFKGPNSNSSFNAIGQIGGMPLLSPFWTPGAKRLP